MNALKTGILLTALTLLFIFLGNMLGGQQGMIIAFVFAIVLNMGAYWFSDKIVLRMYRAKEVSEAELPQVYNIVRNLTQRVNLPMPKVYLIPMDIPNAFATGRNPEHAAVAVTQGILRNLNNEELEGVLAHELAHVRNRDILIQSIVATIVGAIYMLAHMARWAAIFGGRGGRGRGNPISLVAILAASILAPICAMLIQLAISRAREYQADASGARICGKPKALASALQRLHAAAQRKPAQVSPTTAHMFIVNPLSGRGIVALFSTHPPMEERVRRLQSMTL